MKIKKVVSVEIEDREIVQLLIDVLTEKSEKVKGTDGQVYIAALASLVGCSDVDAVKKANKHADDHDLSRITVREFRKWLPTILSEIFADWMNTGQDESRG